MFAVISCLGAPTRHLLMPRDPLQLSSEMTPQYIKKIFWKKFPENPLSHSPKICLYRISNILIILFTISAATCDLHSKHCNYDVKITLSFFYYVIKTFSLRYRWMSHNMSHNMQYICNMFHLTDLPYESLLLWRNDCVMIFQVCNHYEICVIWVKLCNILIKLFTIRTIAYDLQS